MSIETRAQRSLVFGFLLILFLSACSDDGGDDDGMNISEQNEFVHRILLDRYYWYQQVPTSIDYDTFDSPQQTLEFLRYSALDRFSYITTQDAFDSLFNNGTYVGYGFSYTIESANTARVRFVYTRSPAGNAGLMRGDELLSLNGQDVAGIIAANSWDSVLGADEIGVALSLEIRRASGLVETLEMSKDLVTINTVLHSEIIDSGADTIGYLVFSSFLGTSQAELARVFGDFKAAGVNQLILDLRYNGGGSIAVARDLASYIKAADSGNTELYVQLRFNDKHQADNTDYIFRPFSNSLDLDDVVVIITSASCSASEQVISGLQPYLNRVTTIGETSCGKPVGQRAVNFDDLTLLAINFASFNADGQGNYFSGIPADCSSSDDARFVFGDADEPMLSAARYFIENQTCQIAPKREPGIPTDLQGLSAIIGAI